MTCKRFCDISGCKPMNSSQDHQTKGIKFTDSYSEMRMTLVAHGGSFSGRSYGWKAFRASQAQSSQFFRICFHASRLLPVSTGWFRKAEIQKAFGHFHFRFIVFYFLLPNFWKCGSLRESALMEIFLKKRKSTVECAAKPQTMNKNHIDTGHGGGWTSLANITLHNWFNHCELRSQGLCLFYNNVLFLNKTSLKYRLTSIKYRLSQCTIFFLVKQT